MNQLTRISKTDFPGTYTVFINSKTKITEENVWKYLQNTKNSVEIDIEGPRVLLNDIKEYIPIHILVFFITGGLSLFAYLGFYLYEKWKPLYIITIKVNNIKDIV